METEYLDTVNKELLEIEHFFQNLYASSSLPPPYTPGILPLLKPATAHSSFAESSSLHSGLGSTLGSDAGVPEVDMDHLAADLRARYKQLKVVQDRLHIELTKLRVRKLQQQTKRSDQHEQTHRRKSQEHSSPAILASASATTRAEKSKSSNDVVSSTSVEGASSSPSSSSSSSSSSTSSLGGTTRSSEKHWDSLVTLSMFLIALALGLYVYLEMPEYTPPPRHVPRDCPRSFQHDSYPWPRH